MWLSPTAIDESIPALVARRQELAFEAARGAQVVFGARRGPKEVHVLPTNQGKLVSFGKDELQRWTSDPLSAFSELVFISPDPLPSPAPSNSLYPAPTPVPAESVARISHHLKNLRFNSLISALIETFPRKAFVRDVKWLSGEDQRMQDGEGWVSRHSMSEGGRRASDWIVGSSSFSRLMKPREEPSFTRFRRRVQGCWTRVRAARVRRRVCAHDRVRDRRDGPRRGHVCPRRPL